MLWFTLWFMVILKLPILYLCYVIWWAVKDPPEVETEPVLAGLEGDDDGGFGRMPDRRPRPSRRGGPHGSRSRGPVRERVRVRV